MIKNFFKTAWRNLNKNKAYAFINIAGLATGMAVAMLIGLWIYDEVSFDKDNKNYDRIGEVWQFVKFGVEKSSYNSMPAPLAEELRTKYPEFKAVSLSNQSKDVLTVGEKKLSETGNYVQPDFTGMMSLKMLAGTRDGLKDMNSIMLSASLAKVLFGDEDPLNRLIRIGNKQSVKVTGVYEDFPDNSSFKEVSFLAPWDFLVATADWVRGSMNHWDDNNYQIYAQLKEGADFGKVSAKIKGIRMKLDNPPKYNPEFFVHPMSKWHLYGEFKNGFNTGGLIQFVWLFGIIGSFVLLLACINFMNLSTARSEKRAKEVGIRKAIGSVRSQLILQFFSESLLVVAFAFLLSLIIVQGTLPFFNAVAGKKMSILWLNPWFWLMGLGFSLLTGLIAGSYPALYLSSFRPIRVLKGTFKAGRFAAIPRKVLVVFQFAVSVMLIIGTLVVFRQIEFARDRPIGYSSSGLIEIPMNTPDLLGHYEALRTDLLNTGAVSEFSESSNSMTGASGGTTDFVWRGEDPNARPLLISNEVTYDYGKAIGWRISAGRGFSKDFATDSSAIVINEAAAKLMGFKDPLGELVKFHGRDFRVIGIVKNIINESPFKPVNPSFFTLNYNAVNTINIRLAPQLAAREALDKTEKVFKRYNPSSPFTYNFVNEDYSRKFGTEERIGKLSTFFAALAVFISCLGLFGLASFVAEQRRREIGLRKVLGASIVNVWTLLTGEFVVLVIISFFIAAPTAYYFMNNWLLRNYEEYHTAIQWWIFAVTCLGALLITILTVGFQAIKAAVANPVNSLRAE